MPVLPTLGIIAGNGELPLEIAKLYTQKSGKCYIAAIKGEADAKFDELFPCEEFAIGNVEAVINYFNRFGIKNILFAGGVKRPNLRSIKVDLLGAKLIAKILKQKFLGDDTVLKTVLSFFEEQGFKILSAQDIYQNMFKSYDVLTANFPAKQDIKDAELGVKIIKALGTLDIGQSVVVEDGYVLGIEAAEGTDNLISRCAMLRKKTMGAVLIKMPKQGQDKRIDAPTIGVETIENLANYQYNGLVIKKNEVIIIDLVNVIKAANQHKIFILII